MDLVNSVCNLPRETMNGLGKFVGSLFGGAVEKDIQTKAAKATVKVAAKTIEKLDLFSQLGSASIYIRLAGLSGAMAVAMGAYGAHALSHRDDIPEERKEVFNTANRYHFLHSLALLGVPLTHRPHLVGALLVGGMLVFSGTCYTNALTGNAEVIKYTPYGGMALIAGWLAMVL